MEPVIRRYFHGCNAADAAAIAGCFMDDGVHYFPPGMYGGPFLGAREIAERWVAAGRAFDSVWTINPLITIPPAGHAVIEWTHFKTLEGTVLRGDEWYDFDPVTV